MRREHTFGSGEMPNLLLSSNKSSRGSVHDISLAFRVGWEGGKGRNEVEIPNACAHKGSNRMYIRNPAVVRRRTHSLIMQRK